MHHVFNFADFRFVKQELISDMKQIDVKMKFRLIAQRHYRVQTNYRSSHLINFKWCQFAFI